MKIRKPIVTLLLLVIMCFVMTFGVSATEEGSDNNNTFNSYTEFCDDYYSSYELYTVYDKSGVDISTSYYAATFEWYETGDIESIYDYMLENVSRFCKIEIISNKNARGAIQKATQTETFVGYVNNPTLTDYDIVYTLTGTFSYNANTGEVTSYSNPSISLTHVGVSNLISGSMTNASTSAKKTSDGYGVVFEGHFDVVTTQYVPVGLASVPYKSETTGPYKATFTAQGA